MFTFCVKFNPKVGSVYFVVMLYGYLCIYSVRKIGVSCAISIDFPTSFSCLLFVVNA